jgi:hypothetical protein
MAISEGAGCQPKLAFTSRTRSRSSERPSVRPFIRPKQKLEEALERSALVDLGETVQYEGTYEESHRRSCRKAQGLRTPSRLPHYVVAIECESSLRPVLIHLVTIDDITYRLELQNVQHVAPENELKTRRRTLAHRTRATERN